MGRKLDQPEHQSNPGRIVDSGLALERRTRAAGDLAAAQHREHHRGIGRCQRSANDPRQRPVEPERVVRERGQEASRRKRPDHAQREDRAGRGAEPPQADVHPAVEQDHDQCHDRDSLDGHDRHVLVHLRPGVRGERRRNQEDRRCGNRDPPRQGRRHDGERDSPGNEKKEGCEVCDLGHGDAMPTRLPGTPTPNLASQRPRASASRREETRGSTAKRKSCRRWESNPHSPKGTGF